MGQTTETTDRAENLARVIDDDQQQTLRLTARGMVQAIADGDLETALYELETLATLHEEIDQHLISLDG